MSNSGRDVRGLWHVALKVTDLKRSRAFYETFFGMRPVWEPDPANVYLTSGRDNLALHQITASELADYRQGHGQFLDHIGFIAGSLETVDRLHAQAKQLQIAIVHPPKRHRDGSYSFYLADPDGNTVQVLYEPTLSSEGLGKDE